MLQVLSLAFQALLVVAIEKVRQEQPSVAALAQGLVEVVPFLGSLRSLLLVCPVVLLSPFLTFLV